MAFPRRLSAALVCAFAFCAMATSASAMTGPSTNVIGGTPVASDGDYPFLTAILATNDPIGGFYCGGSLIASKWVMTAAHCLAPEAGLTPQYIGIGSADRSSPSMQIIRVTNRFRHPNYEPSSVKNDVMLLRLESAPSGITPVPRATAAQDPGSGVTSKIVGWGLTVSNATASTPTPIDAMEATTEIVSNPNCEAAWSGIVSISDSQICTYHNTPTFHSGCNGDSGGPLLYANRQVGIVSFGVGGCTDQAPQVYTRVSAFQGWIDGTMAKTLAVPDSAVPFGTVDTDDGSVTKTITVTSDGEQPITVTGTSTSGDYAVSSSTCSGPIAPGNSCTFDVTFDPTIGGVRPGTLKISTDSAGIPAFSVPLTGTGFGRSSTPVMLHVKRLSTSRSGSKIKAKFQMDFKVPTGVTPSYACSGKLTSSMRVGGRSYSAKTKVYMVPGKLGVAPRCYSRFTFKMAASALGKKGKLKMRFPKNDVLVSSRRTVSLRIK